MKAKPYKINYPFRKLSKELIHKLLTDISAGSPINFACESHSITYTIFKMWRKQGIIDIESGNEDTLPAQLVAALAHIHKNRIIDCITDIRTSDKGHKGAEWILEHYYQEQFSDNAALRELAEHMEDIKEELYGRKEMDSESNQEKGCASQGTECANGQDHP